MMWRGSSTFAAWILIITLVWTFPCATAFYWLTLHPVFFAYAVVTADSAILFVNDSQIDEAVRKHLGSSVKIKSYESFFPYLKDLSSGLEKAPKPVSLECFFPYTCLTTTPQTKQILISRQASLAVADAVGKVGFCLSPPEFLVTGNTRALLKLSSLS